MTVKHITASTLLWCRYEDGWRLGLVRHPLQQRLLPPGGHVEPHENTEQAALREIAEETGIETDLVPSRGIPLGDDFAATTVERPWWICEHPIAGDNHLAVPHIHVDHVYVGVARAPVPVTPPAHPFDWYPPTEWATLDMPADTRQLAGAALQLLAAHV